MDKVHIGLVHHDSCGCKVKGFFVVFSIERNVSREHSQRVQHSSSLSSLNGSLDPVFLVIANRFKCLILVDLNQFRIFFDVNVFLRVKDAHSIRSLFYICP